MPKTEEQRHLENAMGFSSGEQLKVFRLQAKSILPITNCFITRRSKVNCCAYHPLKFDSFAKMYMGFVPSGITVQA